MKQSNKIALAALAPLLAAVIAAYLWQAGHSWPTSPPEKLTIGSSLFRYSGALYIAEHQGFFKEQGLEVTLKPQPHGNAAILDLRAGNVDLACGGAFVLVQEVLTGPARLRCLAVLGTGRAVDIIARRDRAISRPEDLRGKTIGLPLRSPAEFFLGRFLTFYRMALNQVTLVDINPGILEEALAGGRVDAVVIWEPTTLAIMKRLGNNAVLFPAQEGQDIYWLLMTRVECLKSKPGALEKLLRALEQAVDFIGTRPREARAIIAGAVKFPPGAWDNYPLKYGVFLDQNLLLVLEEEAAWMIKNRLTKQDKIPNFLDYLAPGPLLKINPKAVRLTLPGQKSPE